MIPSGPRQCGCPDLLNCRDLREGALAFIQQRPTGEEGKIQCVWSTETLQTNNWKIATVFLILQEIWNYFASWDAQPPACAQRPGRWVLSRRQAELTLSTPPLRAPSCTHLQLAVLSLGCLQTPEPFPSQGTQRWAGIAFAPFWFSFLPPKPT